MPFSEPGGAVDSAAATPAKTAAAASSPFRTPFTVGSTMSILRTASSPNGRACPFLTITISSVEIDATRPRVTRFRWSVTTTS